MPESSGTERAEEDRQLFDLDKHRSQVRQQLLQCKGQLAMKQKAKRRAELCLQEISSMPDTATTFKAVGRHTLTHIARASSPLSCCSIFPLHPTAASRHPLCACVQGACFCRRRCR